MQAWHGPPNVYMPDWLQDLPWWSMLILIPFFVLLNQDARRWLLRYGMRSQPVDEGVEVSKAAIEKERNLRL